MDASAHLPAPGRARVLVDGLDHPEGVAYDPGSGALWAGGEDGQLYRVDLDAGTAEEVARAPGSVLGLAVDGRGRVVLCAAGDGSVCAYDGERMRRVKSHLAYPNWPAFAPDGSLYVSDSGGWSRNDGRIVRIDADGSADTFARTAPHFTNGCAVTADGEWLWVLESYEPVVSRFELATGVREEVMRIDGTVLDGIAFTAAGGALIACYRPDRVYHLHPSGHLDVVAQDPQGTLLAAPTNVCFAGPKLDQVVSANLGRRHLTLLDLGMRGAAPHRPERWALDAMRVGAST